MDTACIEEISAVPYGDAEKGQQSKHLEQCGQKLKALHEMVLDAGVLL